MANEPISIAAIPKEVAYCYSNTNLHAETHVAKSPAVAGDLATAGDFYYCCTIFH